MKHLFPYVLLILTCQSLLASTTVRVSFPQAYENDSHWPSHVSLTEDLQDENGKRLVSGSIPVVLIRAYQDGQLAIVDRAGTFLIDHSKTDFLKRVEGFQERKKASGDAANFLHQIGRRVFDVGDGRDKAVPESELVKFDGFLICRTSPGAAELGDLLSKLNAIEPLLKSRSIQPILVFEDLMTNEEFYNHLKDLDVGYPVVVPVFQVGFLQAVYTDRESDTRFLLINRNGKLLRAANTVRGTLDNSLDDSLGDSLGD